MDGKDMEEVVRLATKYSFGMVKELLSDNPDYMSRRVATRKYKSLLYEWERRGLVKAVHTAGGKHDVFPKHRLVELYEIYVTGK